MPSSSAVFRVRRPGLPAVSGEALCGLSRRALPDGVREGLRGLAEQALLRTVEAGDPEHVGRLADDVASPTLRAWLAGDLRWLAEWFVALEGPGPLRARLQTRGVASEAKFHVHRLRLRLVVTYVGLGTQVLVDQARGHDAYSEGDGRSVSAFNAALLRAGRGVIQAHPGDVVWLWGEGQPGGSCRGTLHRAPQLEGVRGRRLLVEIDRPQAP